MFSPLYMYYQDAACRLWRRVENINPKSSDLEIKALLKMQTTAEYLLSKSYDLAMEADHV